MNTQADYIFGIRAIAEAIESGKEIDKVMIRKGLNGELFQELFTQIRNFNIPFQYVPAEKLDRITRKNHQGVIAFISPVIFQNIESIIPMLFEQGKNPFILVLDCITDVRNMGAISRSAECAGVHAIVIPEKGSAQINADAMKTSAGALLHIPVCKVKSLLATIKFLHDSGLFIAAATEKATDFYFHTDFNKPTAVILGSEEDGISHELLKKADQLIKIPLQGSIESLNVSAAASAIVFEIVRQRLSDRN